MTYELDRAVMETKRNAAEDLYFYCRPDIDDSDNRNVFAAGYERGWEAAMANTSK